MATVPNNFWAFAYWGLKATGSVAYAAVTVNREVLLAAGGAAWTFTREAAGVAAGAVFGATLQLPLRLGGATLGAVKIVATTLNPLTHKLNYLKVAAVFETVSLTYASYQGVSEIYKHASENPNSPLNNALSNGVAHGFTKFHEFHEEGKNLALSSGSWTIEKGHDLYIYTYEALPSTETIKNVMKTSLPTVQETASAITKIPSLLEGAVEFSAGAVASPIIKGTSAVMKPVARIIAEEIVAVISEVFKGAIQESFKSLKETANSMSYGKIHEAIWSQPPIGTMGPIELIRLTSIEEITKKICSNLELSSVIDELTTKINEFPTKIDLNLGISSVVVLSAGGALYLTAHNELAWARLGNAISNCRNFVFGTPVNVQSLDTSRSRR